MFRRSEAARGAGLTPSAFDGWLNRYDFDLFNIRPSGGWRSFTEEDIFILAVAARLVRFGCPVQTAIDGVHDALFDAVHEGKLDYSKMPTYLYAAEQDGTWSVHPDRNFAAFSAGERPEAVIEIALILCLDRVQTRLGTNGAAAGANK